MTAPTPSMTPATRWWQRVLLIAAAILLVWLPVSPANAAPGGLCYIASGKPVVPLNTGGGAGSGPLDTVTEPTAACDQLSAYTKPGTFFTGSDSPIIDREGNELDAYYFDSGYRGVIDSATHADIKLATVLADMIFSFTRMLVWTACWLLGVAVNFGVAHALIGPVAQATQAYQNQVVDRFGLPTLALMLCVFWFGLAALRGRVGKGAGEILISFCLAAISGVVLAAPADTILGDNGLLGTTREFGITFAALPLDDAKPGTDTTVLTPKNIIVPFQSAIIDTFVRQPHEQLAYGVIFDAANGGKAHPCLDTYNKILKAGPPVDSSPMYDEMKKCDPRLAEHLRQDSGTRIVGALLVAVSALVMLCFVVIGVVIPLLGGQIALAVLAVLLVIALPVSLLGGPGRRALWLWVGSTTSVLAMMVVGFALLSAFLVGAGALTKVEGTGFLLRLLLVVIAAVILLACHNRIRHSTRSYLRIAARRLDRAKIGGSGMGGMGMGGRSWSVRGVWRDVDIKGGRVLQQGGNGIQHVRTAGDMWRRGFNAGAGRDDEQNGHQRDPFPISRSTATSGECPQCHGNGTVSVYLESEQDFDDRECPTCGGTGNAP